MEFEKSNVLLFDSVGGNVRKIALDSNRVKLRREKGRILIYKIDPDYYNIESMGYLHPCIGIFLALLNGNRNESEVLQMLQYIFNMSTIEDARQVAQMTIENICKVFGTEIFLDVSKNGINGNKKEYDPMEFVINEKDVNLKGSRLDAPLDINYIVTQDCFRKCVYCYAETTEAPTFNLLSKERYAEIIEEAGKLQVNTILFSGGDAFFRNDLIDLVELAMKADIRPILSTKAYLTENVCKRLKDINIPYIQVSVDSQRELAADFMCGRKGSFQQINKTLRNLLKYNIPIKAKAVLTPFNVFDTYDWLEHFYNLGIFKFQFVRYGRSAFHHRDSLFVDEDSLSHSAEAIESFKLKHPEIRVDYNFRGIGAGKRPVSAGTIQATKFTDRAICAVGKIGITILPDGRAFACEQLPTKDEFCFGDLKKQSISEVWNSEELQLVVKPPKEKFIGQVCFDCEQFNDCHLDKGRCMRNSFILYGDAYAPDPFCPKAPPAPRQE